MVYNLSYLSQLSYPVKHFLFSNDDNKKKLLSFNDYTNLLCSLIN